MGKSEIQGENEFCLPIIGAQGDGIDFGLAFGMKGEERVVVDIRAVRTACDLVGINKLGVYRRKDEEGLSVDERPGLHTYPGDYCWNSGVIFKQQVWSNVDLIFDTGNVQAVASSGGPKALANKINRDLKIAFARIALENNAFPDYLQDGLFLMCFLGALVNNPAWYAALVNGSLIGGSVSIASSAIALWGEKLLKSKGLSGDRSEMSNRFPRSTVLALGRIDLQNIVLFLVHVMSRKYVKVLEK